MFSRLSRQMFNNFQMRNYWIPPTEPTHDIITTIKECQKGQLTFLVKNHYNAHYNGGNIIMEPKQVLSCEKFTKIKNAFESEKYMVNVSKDKTLGPNAFGVRLDEFNKRLDIFV